MYHLFFIDIYSDVESLNMIITSKSNGKEIDTDILTVNEINKRIFEKVETFDDKFVNYTTTSHLIDSYVLKSQNKELKSKIAALETENSTVKAQIAPLQLYYPWFSFYEGFTKRFEHVD